MINPGLLMRLPPYQVMRASLGPRRAFLARSMREWVAAAVPTAAFSSRTAAINKKKEGGGKGRGAVGQVLDPAPRRLFQIRQLTRAITRGALESPVLGKPLRSSRPARLKLPVSHRVGRKEGGGEKE